ncbi:unnamed protein product [Orchesella dallaii]|uniref:GT23 domain-containing protein n=1 Tax=Orchesella dallaii TaxID=48710 RepID=A0ABP1R063_9HEXA
MSSRRNKSLAVVFIILFLGYYQRWLYAVIYESLNGSVDLDPALPMIIDGIQKFNSLQDDDSDIDDRAELQMERESVSAALPAMAYLMADSKLQAQADALSQRIQMDIDSSQFLSQRKFDCKGPKLHCGSTVNCGLGCQIHKLMSCVMVAYMTNRTLVPDFRNWPYSVPWTDVFRPIGAPDCPTDNETALVRWGKTGFTVGLPDKTIYSYKSGIPVPLSVGPDLKMLPTDHYVWWISQFAKYTMRLQSWEEELMAKFKDVLKLQIPTVGIVVRKRDKRGEKRKLEIHSIDKYMSLAKKYFSKLEETQTNVTRRILLSTDDRNVFKLVRKRYRPPRWQILGFQRKTDVEDIVKDIYMLSQCHFVVCSFSADVS